MNPTSASAAFLLRRPITDQAGQRIDHIQLRNITQDDLSGVLRNAIDFDALRTGLAHSVRHDVLVQVMAGLTGLSTQTLRNLSAPDAVALQSKTFDLLLEFAKRTRGN